MYSCGKGITNHARAIGDAVAGIVFMGTPHPRNDNEALQLHSRFLRAFPERSRSNSDLSESEAARLVQVSLDFERAHQALPIFTVYETQKTRLSSRFLAKKLKVHRSDFSFPQRRLITPTDS